MDHLTEKKRKENLILKPYCWLRPSSEVFSLRFFNPWIALNKLLLKKNGFEKNVFFFLKKKSILTLTDR